MKKHVVAELQRAGMTGREAAATFEAVERAIARAVEEGKRVRLEGVGTLYKKTRADQRFKHPRTGEISIRTGGEVVALRSPRRF